MGRLLQLIFGALFGALIGLFVGAAIVSVIYVVKKRVSLRELPEIIRNALRSSNEEKAREMIAKALEATITSTDVNTINIDVLAASGEQAKVTIKCDSVDEAIKAGMKVSA